MPVLPEGTVTLLFTDVEGSTRMLQSLGREKYARALEEHRALVRSALRSCGGVEVEMQGDSFHFAFAYARDGVAGAAGAQRALSGHSWADAPMRVRIGLHTGEPMQVGGLYTGIDVHRAARVMDAAHGGQILLTERTAGLVEGELPADTDLRNLGRYQLKDFDHPLDLFELTLGSDDRLFPPLRAPSADASRRRSRRSFAVFAVAAVVATVIGVALLAVRDDPAPSITPNSLVLLDADTLEPIDVLTVGRAPGMVRASEDAAWVLDADDRTVTRVSSVSMELRTVSVGLDPTSLAVSEKAVWVSDGSTGAIASVDPIALSVEFTIQQPELGQSNHHSGVFGQLALVDNSLWVSNRDRTLSKIDAARGVVSLRSRIGGLGPNPDVIGADRAGVWLGVFELVYRVSPGTGEVAGAVELTFNEIDAIAVGNGSVWVTTPATDTVWQINPETERVHRAIQIAGGPSALAIGDDATWVGTERTGTLARVEATSGRVTRLAELGRPIRSIAVAEHGIWVTVA